MVTLLTAILVKDLSSVFEFTGAFGCSTISFLVPSIGYLLALNRYGTSRRRQKWETFLYQLVSWLFLVVYAIILGTYVYI